MVLSGPAGPPFPLGVVLSAVAASSLPLPLTLTLPAAQRAAVLRLTDRMARKRHGMAKHAAEASTALRGDSNQMRMPYLAAACVAAAVRGWSAGASAYGADLGALRLALVAIEKQLARPLAHPRY